MIDPALYRQPVPLDPVAHRHKKIGPVLDYSIVSTMHASYVSMDEMLTAALEFPIVFVETGERDAAGKAWVLPVALLGVSAGENLFVEGQRWDGRYIPAMIRRYPFASARVAGAAAPVVLIDSAWPGVSDTEGMPLFDAEGKATENLTGALRFLEMFDREAAATRQFCAWLQTLEILQPMTVQLTLPDGTAFSMDGFQSIEEARLNALPDAQVLELHRNGVLRLLHALQVSLGNTRFLTERKARRMGASPPTA